MPAPAYFSTLSFSARYVWLGLLMLIGLGMSSPAQMTGRPWDFQDNTTMEAEAQGSVPNTSVGDLEVWIIP